MRKSGFLLFPVLLGFSLAANAQDVVEAHNFSNVTTQGTARSMGFGNTLGSVGGDFGSLTVNPAGIGVYRSSEISMTPSLKINATSSEYTGVTTEDNNTNFNFNNFGIILTHAPRGERYDHKRWKTVSFGFGMNRVADFNSSYLYNGRTNSSSASQVFESDANLNPDAANSSTPASTLGYLGYNSYLLNINGANQYQSIVPFTGGVNQQKSMQTWGGIKEYALTLGGNYMEKLMLGATIGIPVINYHSDSYFEEWLADGNTASNPYGFKSFNYNRSADITGSGINAKIGAIYKFSDVIRIGAAFHTPTYYNITDISNPGITTVHAASGLDSVSTLAVYDGTLLQNQFDYNLTTPWKGVVSATIVLNKIGFITADYEYVDYSSMRYSYPAGIDNFTVADYKAEADLMNQKIKKTFTGASNFRVGAEAVFANVFMVRGGFGYYGNAYSPYGQSVSNNGYYSTERMDISLGAGLHFRNFFADLAVVHSMYQGYERPYSIDNAGVVTSITNQSIATSKIDFNTNNVALTVGMKFNNRTSGGRRGRSNS